MRRFVPWSRRVPALLATALAALGSGGVVAVANVATAVPAAASGSCVDAAVTVTSINPPVFYRDAAASLTAGYAGYRVSTTAPRGNVWVELSGFTGGAVTRAPSQ